MRATPSWTRFSLQFGLVLILLSAGAPAWALGAGDPPLLSAVAFISTNTTAHEPGATNGIPQLSASADVLIPGGRVPADVQSVTVLVPGEGSPRTLFKDVGDMFQEISYFLNLTQAGVVGFPPGQYTFTVTDTAGGQTVVTDTLSAVAPLAAATNVTISGASPVSADAFRAGFTPTSLPTVGWTPGLGARQRVRVRQFAGPDLFNRFIGDGLTNSLTLPAGIFVPGRLYQVIVETQDVDFNTRGRRTVQLFVDGPDVLLSATGSTANGQTLRVNANVLNTGGPVTVRVLVWIGLPDGRVITLFDLPAVTIPTATPTSPNGNSTFFSGPIFTRTWDGTEPTGLYVVGILFQDLTLGQTMVRQTLTFRH